MSEFALPATGQSGCRRTMHEQGGLAGCWPRSRHGWEELVTDGIDGPSGADGQSGRKDEGRPFSTMTVGNSAGDRADWIVDDLLSAEERTDPAPGRDAQALTRPIRQSPWATRRMGSPRPVTPESNVTQPLPARMLRAAPHVQTAGSGKSAAARTEMLRVLPPKPPAAVQPGTLAPPPAPCL
jgi:hypothetical protein